MLRTLKSYLLALDLTPAMAVKSKFTRFHSTAAGSKPSFSNYIITPDEFMQHYPQGGATSDAEQARGSIKALCAAWFLPNDPQQRTGQSVFEQARIPGARFFDIDKVKDNQSPYPHMLPSATEYSEAMTALGLRRDDTIVVYDTKELGLFSAPRVAWTLRIFGHRSVHILNNFRIYVERGFPLETGPPKALSLEASDNNETKYEMDDNKIPKPVVDFDYMRQFATEQSKQSPSKIVVLDARPKGRFDGQDPEPRPGLSSGHMPGSVSVPFADLLNPDTKALLSAEDLKAIFNAKGVEPGRPIISSCGTGVTAAVVDAALEEAGFPQESRLLYDGSWTEWAMRVKPEDELILKN